MKQLLLIIALVVLVGCGATSWVSDPSNPNNVIIEKVIREAAKKPRGELTKADLEKVTKLELFNNQLTNVKDLEKLTQLEWLDLSDNQLSDLKGLEKLTQLKTLVLLDNPDLAKAQISELLKALPPKCIIWLDCRLSNFPADDPPVRFTPPHQTP